MASVEIYPGFGGNRIERISVSILKERWLKRFCWNMTMKVLGPYILRRQNAENEHPFTQPSIILRCILYLGCITSVFAFFSCNVTYSCFVASSVFLSVYLLCNTSKLEDSPSIPIESTCAVDCHSSQIEASSDKWTVPSRFIDVSCQLCSHSFSIEQSEQWTVPIAPQKL